jgi:hypothetical protein
MSGGMAERLELQPLSGHAVVRLPRRPAAPLSAAELSAAELSAAERRKPAGGRRNPRADRIRAGRERPGCRRARPSALTSYALVTGSSTLLPRSLSGTGTG